MKQICLRQLAESASRRPQGYMESVLALGTVDGEWLLLSDEAYTALCEQYRRPGLGDRVAQIAKPIARALDAVLDTDLEHCQTCEARQKWLNEHFPGN